MRIQDAYAAVQKTRPDIPDSAKWGRNIPKYSRWGQNARRWSWKEMSVQNSLHTGKRSNWCNNLIHSPAKRLQNAKSCKIEWTSLLYYISLLFNSFLSSKLTFIVLSSSIRLNMKFFQRCSMWRWEKAPWQSEQGFEVFQRGAESGNVLATCALTISTIATAATIKLADHTICQKQNSCWSVFLLQWDTFEREL